VEPENGKQRARRAGHEPCDAPGMKRKSLRLGKGFRVAFGNRRAQGAEMSIPPGDAEGGPDNRHRGADQWLFVVSGTGTAIGGGKRHPLRAGTLLLIGRGERHEIRNTGRGLLRTVNVYVPPAYKRSGDPLPRGRK
jgi:mannose-6-phosphate isomerase-like protein (cupin superfamily)